MKTFQEAVEATLMAKVPIEADEAEKRRAFAELSARVASYQDTIREIQMSAEAHIFAEVTLSHMPDDLDLQTKIVIAISHAVMIGMEMEKPDTGRGCPLCGSLKPAPGRTLYRRIADWCRMRLTKC